MNSDSIKERYEFVIIHYGVRIALNNARFLYNEFINNNDILYHTSIILVSPKNRRSNFIKV